MKTFATISISLVLSLFLLGIARATPYQLTTPFAGFERGATPGIVEYIGGIYVYALGAVGLVALGVIIFWGVVYTLSAGMVAKKQDAIDGITQAVYGLLLLLGAYLILYTINPALVTLREPRIKPLLNAPAIAEPQNEPSSDFLGRNLGASDKARAQEACEGSGGTFTEFTDASGTHYSCLNNLFP